MSTELTVVMYHFVRETARARFPALKALDLRRFRAQLAWARRHHAIVRMDQVLDALDGGEPLPPRALLLTFDDGYADHYAYAFPVLDELGIQGSFFVSARPTLEHALLDANKVHLVLASHADAAAIARAVTAWIDRHGPEHALEPAERYVAAFAKPTRFDPPEVTFVKRVLQRGLPPGARRALLDELLATYVGVDEPTLAEELYASPEQLRTMHRHGMHLGGHGVDHAWMTSLPAEALRAEVAGSHALLTSLGVAPERRTFAYPYGDVDDAVAAAVAASGFRAGFTIEPAVAVVDAARRMRLPRLDTNDLPP